MGKVAGELRSGPGRIVAQEQTASHRKPRVTHRVGIAEKPGEAIPVGDFDFCLGSINDRFFKGYGKADSGAENLVVVGVVVDIAAEVVRIEAELTGEALRGSDFKVIAVRWFPRQA